MPVIRDISFTLTSKQILRRLGLGDNGKLQPRILDTLNELLSTVFDDKLLRSSVAYELYDIYTIEKDTVFLSKKVVFHSHLLALSLLSAKQIAVVICTIGPDLEEKASAYFKSKEELKGYLLDGIGSAAIDRLAAEACYIIGRKVSESGYQAGSPISPGMPGMLPLSEQQTLFDLVPGDEIGVQLTPLQVMFPVKSVSMVIGIGPQVPRWTQAETCARCNLKQTCTHKIRSDI